MSDLDAVLPALKAALAETGSAVLTAPPGTGKTTRVPPALLDVIPGRIVMLEPRRAAARAAARRIAAGFGEGVGETVGLRSRGETRVGAATRIIVATDGSVLRMMQADPGLDGVGLLIFDEAHERGLESDTALALALDIREGLRPDLKLLVMSATLAADAFAALLGDPPVLTAGGAPHPVDILWRPDQSARRPPPLWAQAADAARAMLTEGEGDILVFLPGRGEIARAAEALADLAPAIAVLPLHGGLTAAEQDAALAPDPDGRRRIVLATDIAESSVTLPGVRIVIDGGVDRGPVYDPASGLTWLADRPASKASCDQRAGRAGRLGPGLCVRLWAEAAHGARPAAIPPEIGRADLTGLALQLAQWGAAPADLRWLSPPPDAAWAVAIARLTALGALDADGRLTRDGRLMAAAPLPPALAALVLVGRGAGHGPLARDAAALLSEGGLATVDLRNALRWGLHGPARAAAQAIGRVFEIDGRWRDVEPLGGLLARAMPERIAEPRAQEGRWRRFRLAGGGEARLAEDEALAAAGRLVAAEISGREALGIRAAAPIADADWAALLAAAEPAIGARWDEPAKVVKAFREKRLGAAVLERAPLAPPPPDPAVRAALLDGLRRRGAGALPWSKAALRLRARAAALGDGPDWSDAALTETLADWLGPHLDGCWRLADLDAIDLAAALMQIARPDLPARLVRETPERWTAPSGRAITLDWSGDGPAAEAKVQEVFGLAASPRFGAKPLTLRLLDPAGRPTATTADLARFWDETYPLVRKELRGRYPKHDWPEDPLVAAPGKGPKRRK